MTMELPSLLAFERKLESSDALMFSGKWADINEEEAEWQPVGIIPRNNRSTQSAQGISDDKKAQPNPVAASNDDANLPLDHDTLKVHFTLRIIGNLGLPFACNNPKFEQQIKDKVQVFQKTSMLDELAKRYASNIANGRFLWRNRVNAEQITIYVTINESDHILTFDAYHYSLEDFNQVDGKIEELAQAIKMGLSSNQFVLININAFVKLGNGQHVFPSQEMNMGEKRKVLFKINNQAAIHNVKIGNALRTIDTWYEDDAKFPIAAEPYGAVTQRGVAYRKSVNDLYTLMDHWVNDEAISDIDQAFIVANLIRGGVFSKGGE